MRDTLGSTASATLTIDISGTNDSPVITSDGAGASAAISIAENSTAVTTVQATDVDGSSRTYSIVTGEDSPDATKFIINPVTGALSFAAAPNFEIPASEAESAVYTVQVQVEDGAGGLDVQTIIVTVTDVAEAAPVIVTNAFTVTENENGTTTVKGLYVTDADATADETFHITTETEADLTDGGVEPSDQSGTLSQTNEMLSIPGTGITYDPGSDPPETDMVTVTVEDGDGHTDTVNLIFNQAGTGPDVTLAGTAEKDVFFGTGYQDTFVFAADSNHDIIRDFTPDQDRIDLQAFSEVDSDNIATWLSAHAAAAGADTLITLEANDTITLKGVALANLHASDFIVSPHA
jgi:hypothetical protein